MKSKIMWLSAMLLLAVIIVVAKFANEGRVNDFLENGIVAKAKVIQKYKETKRVGRGRYETNYFAWLSFKCEDKKAETLATEYLFEEKYNSLEEGDSLQFVYLPSTIYELADGTIELNDISFPDALNKVKERGAKYYYYALIPFILAFVPFFFKRKQKKIQVK